MFKDKTTYIFFSSWRFVLNSDNCSKRITCLIKPAIHDFVVMVTIFFRVYIFVNKITKQLRICTLLFFWYYVFINYHWYIVFTVHIFLDTSESWKLYFAVALLCRYRKKERMPHDVILAHKNDKNHFLMYYFIMTFDTRLYCTETVMDKSIFLSTYCTYWDNVLKLR